MGNPVFLLSSDPAKLAAALEGKRSATVEAEYGDRCVPGSILTMAHHGPRTGQKAPCAYPNDCVEGEDVEAVGLSHVDLDTLGGCAAIMDMKPDASSFWELVEFVDLNGAHKLSQSGANEQDLRRLWAFWAWLDNNRPYPPRDGSVLDVTEQIMGAMGPLMHICLDNESYLMEGDKKRAVE